MNTAEFEKLKDQLWQTAKTLRAQSDLKSNEYSTPVLGMIFLKFADNKYKQYEKQINEEYNQLKGTRREKEIHKIAIEKCGFYLPPKSRYDYLLTLPEEEDIDKALKTAMELIEKYKTELDGVLPKDEYFKLTRTDKALPKSLLKNFSDIPIDASGDIFGRIYEYFLGKFALSEGQGGGEFFTPNSVVRLMVEIIEPHNGSVFDPACGSGGMFVQSARFIEKHIKQGSESDFLVNGQEKTDETVKLAKMNLVVNGLRGEVKQANTYSEDAFGSFGKYDFVMANPPFNVKDVKVATVEEDKRFNTFGIPRNKTKKKGEEKCPNANYLWINLFATSLKDKGRAALVMANSASDARNSEADIRQKLIEENLIYGMLTLPSNMFYTVTLPATLWFFDKDKIDDKILFIDARNIFTQIDRAHREFSDEQIQNIAIINHLYKNDRKSYLELIDEYFTKGISELTENKSLIEPLSDEVKEFLKKQKEPSIPNLNEKLSEIIKFEEKVKSYKTSLNIDNINQTNEAQKNLAEEFKPFFADIHIKLKEIDKLVRKQTKEGKSKADARDFEKEIKQIKIDLADLHKVVKDAEMFFIHINWLQERFPEAKYEDVTGLCKAATPEEVKEQDYSLNPGRYVGVVIEEDGKTEEEFIEEIVYLNDELLKLNADAKDLENIINHNIMEIIGE